MTSIGPPLATTRYCNADPELVLSLAWSGTHDVTDKPPRQGAYRRRLGQERKEQGRCAHLGGDLLRKLRLRQTAR